MKYLQQLDLFGVPIVQRINEKEILHKSITGGIFTIIIFLASIAYSTWVFYQWGTNSLNPTIITQYYTSDFKTLDLDYQAIKINYLNYVEDYIDPFKSNIYLAVAWYSGLYKNGTLFFEQVVLRPQNETDYLGSPYLIPQMLLKTNEYYDTTWSSSSQMYIFFIACSQELLSDDEQCASQDTIDQFYSQQSSDITIEIHTKILNPQDQSIQNNVQLYYLQLEQTLCTTLNTNLRSTYYEISDYFIFGSARNVEYLNGIEVYTLTNTVGTCDFMYGMNNIYGVMVVQMFNTQQKTILQYPGAGQLFANIGSIISILFTLRFFIFKFNQQELTNKVINQLIKMYFPQYSKITVIKNWRKKTVAAYKDSQLLNLDEYIKFDKRIRQIFEQKLSWINQMYEISRLYLILRSFLTREEIKKFHNVGISLNVNTFNTVETYRSTIEIEAKSDMILNEEDAALLNFKEKVNEQSASLRNSYAQDFFELNYII